MFTELDRGVHIAAPHRRGRAGRQPPGKVRVGALRRKRGVMQTLGGVCDLLCKLDVKPPALLDAGNPPGRSREQRVRGEDPARAGRQHARRQSSGQGIPTDEFRQLRHAELSGQRDREQRTTLGRGQRHHPLVEQVAFNGGDRER